MSDMKIILIGVSDEQCKLGRLNLKVLMEKALRVEMRMVNKVLIEDEQRRYSTYCDRIEFFGHRFLVEGKVLFVDLGDEYLDIISELVNKYPGECRSARLTANFCTREHISEYIRRFETIAKQAGVEGQESVRKKLKFYIEAESANLNVIELTQAWIPGTKEVATTNSADLEDMFLKLQVADEATLSREGGHFVALRAQFERVVDQTVRKIPSAINFSELRHDVIAEVLHEFVYKRGRPLYIPVTYADGSEASPLPLFCLKTRDDRTMTAIRQLPVLNVGMMSARHSNDGLDIKVQAYWFRNQEISIGRTQAETDMVAYRKSKELLMAMRSEGGYRIAFYQTGFQPAVVGFYRALTEELIFREKGEPSLEITPYYFMGGEYKVGKVWC